MTRPPASFWAWLLLAATLSASAAALPGLLGSGDVVNESAWGFKGLGLLAAVVFALTGALLALKKPDNAVGWLFGGVGVTFAVITLTDFYAVYPLIRGSKNDVVYAWAWFNSWGWIAFLGLISFAILLFPSGHLPSRRWKVRARFMAGGFVFGCFAFAVAPGPLNNIPPRFTNRYALPEGPLGETILYAGMMSFMAALLLAAIGVVQRYRTSEGLQRQQMKMFVLSALALAASMTIVVIGELAVSQIAEFSEILTSVALLMVPVAMAFAILRYRLYDIDLIINRALVYSSVSGVLAAVYLGGVVLLQQLLAPLTADSDAAIAASTLAVAAMFRPLRSRVQTFIDRRFYRRRYDAAEALSDFAARLRNQVDLDALTSELLNAAGSTVQPAHASIWLKPAELGDSR
ncbi:MAG TPA: hypothetical protein VJ927_00455 [Actinomycetota bacterium]|nr:hypothetical protein [Actinomycetota bacterium]